MSFLGKTEKKEKPSKKPKEKPKKEVKKLIEKPEEPAISKPKEIIEKKSDETAEEDRPIPEEKESPQPPKQSREPIPATTETADNLETKKPSFLSKFVSKLTTTTLTQKHVDEIFEPLELILLENNVALEVVDKIRKNLYEDLIGLEIKKSADFKETIKSSLKESIDQVLIEPTDLFSEIKKKLDTYVIIFFGINGSGKTTSIAKLAYKLKKEKISCVLAAADTFRAASIEQLETHANRLGVPIIKSQYGSDPTSVAFDAVKYAEKNKIKCVLIDTAGRMYTKENLIKQMEKIIRIIKPDLKIFVGESITGNDATQQARKFNEAVGIDGIILTKADVDEKGGTALSVSQVTGKPIYFLGTGQDYDDLQDFKKSVVLKNLGLD